MRATLAVVGCVLVSLRWMLGTDLYVLLGVAFVIGGLITAAGRERRQPGRGPAAAPARRAAPAGGPNGPMPGAPVG